MKRNLILSLLFCLSTSQAVFANADHYTTRTIDGKYNNIKNKNWGKSGCPFSRFAQDQYTDKKDGEMPLEHLPNPRRVSNEIFNQKAEVLNDRNLSALAEGSYFVEKLKPGTVKILVQGNHNRDWSFGPIGVSVNANPGERRYYRIGTGINGILITPIIGGYSREMRIEEVPEDFALQDLSKLRSMR